MSFKCKYTAKASFLDKIFILYLLVRDCSPLFQIYFSTIRGIISLGFSLKYQGNSQENRKK